jgi:transcriptional regulator with XRE-family HTH domain
VGNGKIYERGKIMNFGEKLEMLRIKSGLNKKQLGEKVEVAADTISKYIKKETVEGIDAIVIKRIAGFFGVYVDYLTNNTESLPIDIQKDDLNYLHCEEKNDIDLVNFVSEFKYYIETLNFVYNSSKLETEKKKYIIDSLGIGLKLLEENSK